jgi:hypothetical protein
MIPFLGVLGAVMPPIVGVVLLRTGRNRNWHAWTAWAAGSATAITLLVAGYPVHVLAGVATSGILLFLLGLTVPDDARSGACPIE